jgi:hypothetical protein
VVVPVTDRSTAARDDAQHRLDAQLARLADLDADATGELTQADPHDATMAALAQRDIHELIVCTLPPGLSRWLGTDLVGRLHRATDLPITHISSRRPACPNASPRRRFA